MKKFCNISMLLIILLLLSACVEVKTRVVVNKNGTGMVEETVLFNDSYYDFFVQGYSPDKNKQKVYDVVQFKETASFMGKDVKFVSVEDLKTDNSKGYRVTYQFKNIEALKISDQPLFMHQLNFFKIGLNPDESHYTWFSFKWSKEKNKKLIVSLPSRNFDTEPEKSSLIVPEIEGTEGFVEEETDDSEIENIKGAYQNMKLTFILSFPDMKETDASFTEGHDIVIWDVNFNDIFKKENSKEIMKLMENPFDQQSKKSLLKIQGLKVEEKESIIVHF